MNCVNFASALLTLLGIKLSTTHAFEASSRRVQQLPSEGFGPLHVSDSSNTGLQRRDILGLSILASSIFLPSTAHAAQPNGLPLTTTASGLRFADAKVGTGEPVRSGSTVSIDYSMASTAGRVPLIYSTKDTGTPYRWKLGDGSTIAGIEMAILGDPNDEALPPMRPGGIRRVIVPESLGFQSLAKASSNAKCLAGNPGSIGPIPPKEQDLGAYQRWYQFYCNPRIPYQPDLVLDIKLYGSR